MAAANEQAPREMEGENVKMNVVIACGVADGAYASKKLETAKKSLYSPLWRIEGLK